MSCLVFPPALLAAATSHGDQRVTIFFTQILLLVVAGRLLSEAMQRLGQPAVMGQLLAGILLGPSVFGAVWPAAQHLIFPVSSGERQMLNAVSELGVLMLLLLTGMETDLALVKRVRRTAAFTSAAGIVIPFACGYALGEVLPASVLPDPSRRLITSLFLATALSISSVKIVAAVLREVDYLRRNLGQIILASAILDDTIGWTILALIGGIAAHGKIVVAPLLLSVLGTAAFLLISFTVGRRWTAQLIRWTNDHLVIEMPVISVILAIMIVLALVTSAIGVHTVLGAFVAGILIGQSPILTRHIEEQVRGLIVALFMPVFFGVAGLSIDLKVLADPHLLGLSLLLIAIASVGKLGGCYVGGRLGSLNHPEALAVGLGMNARGSTEVILATVGLAMGVLNQQLFTMIVVMAVVTTLCMPPLLRWALARVPIRSEEKLRLEAAVAEENDLMPKVERVLVGLDDCRHCEFAARLAGWFIGARQLSATVMDLAEAPKAGEASTARLLSRAVIEAAQQAARTTAKAREAESKPESKPIEAAAGAARAEAVPVKELVSIIAPKTTNGAAEDGVATSLLAEAKNGYGLVFLGLKEKDASVAGHFSPALEKIVREFAGPTAILLHRGAAEPEPITTLEKILVATTGADYSRFGAEVAVAIAKGCGATITALHVSAPPAENELLRRPEHVLRTGRALIGDIVALGEREGVRVVSKLLRRPEKETAILRQLTVGGHQLVVVGTKARYGEELHFGYSAMALLEKSPCPILLVKS